MKRLAGVKRRPWTDCRMEKIKRSTFECMRKEIFSRRECQKSFTLLPQFTPTISSPFPPPRSYQHCRSIVCVCALRRCRRELRVGVKCQGGRLIQDRNFCDAHATENEKKERN